MKKKTVAMLMALVLVLGGVIGGTIAWLTAQTDTVTNTFSTSGIAIDLTETTGSDYVMVPGYTLAKDPTITVEGGSEACYLFVMIAEDGDFSSYMSYALADGWTALDGVAGVYYKTVSSSDADQTFAVLKDNQVVVLDTVTEEMLEKADGVALSFTAYASQLYKSSGVAFTAAEAWANVYSE